MTPAHLSNYRVFDAPPEPDENDVTKIVGQVALLMGKVASRHGTTVVALSTIALYAIRHKSLKIYYDSDGRVVAFVMWALLAEDVERRILDTGQIYLHESEWNEGENLWIIDFLAPFGHAKYVVRDLKRGPLRQFSSVQYLRQKGNEVVHSYLKRNKQFSSQGPNGMAP